MVIPSLKNEIRMLMSSKQELQTQLETEKMKSKYFEDERRGLQRVREELLTVPICALRTNLRPNRNLNHKNL